MPRYYGVMIHPNGDAAIGNFGENEPQQLAIPDRPSDFPFHQLPVAEEARVDAINRLFPNWVEHCQRPCVLRINDDGSVDAWLLDIDEDDSE